MTSTAGNTAALLRPPTAKEQAALSTEKATPSPDLGPAIDEAATGQTRKALEGRVPTDLTPAVVLRAMRCARDLSDVPFFVSTALELLRRDLHLRGLLQGRVQAVLSLPRIVESIGDTRIERKAAAEMQRLLDGPYMTGVMRHQLALGLWVGFGPAETLWDFSAQPWRVRKLVKKPAHWFTFDKRDGGTTPYLLPAEAGQAPRALESGAYVVHMPELLPGNPLTAGYAYSVMAWLPYKTIALHGWAAFSELHGQPFRVGKYPAELAQTDQGRKNIEVLKSALRELGADAWAALPRDMEIDFIEAADRGGSIEVYERLCRFIDEQNSRLIHGGNLVSGTGNTGSGGTQSLGEVHAGQFESLVDADAASYAETIREQLVRCYVAWNYGPDVPVPLVYFQNKKKAGVPEAQVLAHLVPLGLRIAQDEVRAKFDYRDPGPDDELLAPAAPSLAGQDEGSEGFTASRSAHPSRFAASTDDKDEGDDFDDLLGEYVRDPDYVDADKAATDALTAAIESAQSIEDLRAALLAVIRGGDIEALQASLTAPLTVAAAAGESGADIGTE